MSIFLGALIHKKKEKSKKRKKKMVANKNMKKLQVNMWQGR